MADIYKKLGALAPTDSLEHVLYTAPAGKTALISNITVVNRANTYSSFSVHVHPQGITEGTVANASDKSILLTAYSYSLDGGTTWIPSQNQPTRAAAGPTLLAGFNNSNPVTSTDGAVWIDQTTPVVTSSWQDIAYGAGKFVTVINNTATAVISTDGITWTTSTLPSSNSWYSVAYGNGIFVANTTTQASAISTDGITWTSRTLPVSSVYKIVYAGGVFVGAQGNSTTAIRSTDGNTWTTHTLPASLNWTFLTYGSGKFFVAAQTTTNTGAYSTDGITWTASTYPASFNAYGAAYSSGYFYVIPVNSFQHYRSTDAVTWEVLTHPIGYSNKLTAVDLSYNSTNKSLYKNSYIEANSTEVLEPGAIVSEGQTVVVRGTPDTTISAYGVELDGTSTYKILGQVEGTWDGALAYTVPEGKQALIRAISYSNESPYSTYAGLSFGNKQATNTPVLVALPSYMPNRLAAVSTDGRTWSLSTVDTSPVSSPIWNSIVYAQDKFVAVGSNGFIGVSGDGKYWNVYASSGADVDVAYGNDVFVSSGSSSIRVSTDGISWRTANSAPTVGVLHVAYGNGKFVIVRESSTVGAYSTDGITWTTTTMPAASNWRSIAYGAGKFVVVANFASNYYSTDGITWSLLSGLPSNQWRKVTFGGGLFIACGASNSLYTSTDGLTWTSRSSGVTGSSWATAAGGPSMYLVGGSTTGTANQLTTSFSTNGTTWSPVTLPATAYSANSAWNAVGIGTITTPIPQNVQYVQYNTVLQGYESLNVKAGYALEAGTKVYALSPNNVTTTIFGMEI